VGANRLLRSAVPVAACVVLTAFGGTGLAVTLRKPPTAPPPASASPVLQPFERPGESFPRSTSTAAPVVKKAKEKETLRPALPKTVVRAIPKPTAPPPPTPKPVRATPKPAPTPAFTAPKPSGGGANNTALLIGINEAPGSEVLQGMVEDTRTMKTMLLGAGYKSENIKVLTDKQATRSAILSALDSLARRTSGKGLAVVSISSHSGVSGGDMTFATGGGGRISRAELASRLGKVRGRLWTTISTCYSAAYDTPGITGRNRIAMFTASKDELSYQNAAGSLSIVYMIQRGMIDRGIRSVEDAHAYASSALGAAGAGSKVPILKDWDPGRRRPRRAHRLRRQRSQRSAAPLRGASAVAFFIALAKP
jgi:hypothetical protein